MIIDHLKFTSLISGPLGEELDKHFAKQVSGQMQQMPAMRADGGAL